MRRQGIRWARRQAYAAAAGFLRDTALWDVFDSVIENDNEEVLAQAVGEVAAALERKARLSPNGRTDGG